MGCEHARFGRSDRARLERERMFHPRSADRILEDRAAHGNGRGCDTAEKDLLSFFESTSFFESAKVAVHRDRFARVQEEERCT